MKLDGLLDYAVDATGLGPVMDLMNMGVDDFGSGDGGGYAPASGSGPLPGGGGTEISPTIQTQVSPQISPVFQQTQASPGASQAATTEMIAPMTDGRGGAAFPSAFPEPFRAPLIAKSINYVPAIIVGTLSLAGLIAYQMRQKGPKRARK